MNRSLLETQLPTLVHAHVPHNVREFKYRIFDRQPAISTLGFALDPQPFDGTVVAIKTARTQFAVLDRELVTTVPDEGDKVQVRPYARRRFDGLRADTPTEETHISSDGTPYKVLTHVLGEASAKLPIPAPQCPELAALIEQMENLPAPDRFRKITQCPGVYGG